MQFTTQTHAVSNRFATRHGLHPTDVTALAVLASARRPLTAGQLAAALELSSGATTRLVDRLERRGHLTRETDPDDRRRRLVSLTPSAASTANAYVGQISARVSAVLAAFDEAEQAVLTRFLDRLVAQMHDLPGGAPEGLPEV